jgi:hypothetical protein
MNIGKIYPPTLGNGNFGGLVACIVGFGLFQKSSKDKSK